MDGYFGLLYSFLFSLIPLGVAALVGYRFYKLATKSKGNPWLHASLGAIVYFLLTEGSVEVVGTILLRAQILANDQGMNRYVIFPIIQMVLFAIFYWVIFQLRKLHIAVEANPQMTLARQLLCFTGRSGRRDFWLKGLLPVHGINILMFVPVVPIEIAILSLWPATAIYIKRLMDRDRSPWLFLLALVPVVGAIWLIIETWFLKGTTGQNRYGPDPVPKGT